MSLDQRTRRLWHREITFASAKGSDLNILHALGYFDGWGKFLYHLYCRQSQIEGLVAQHLGIAPQKCHAADAEQWITGTFNVCVRVDVDQDPYPVDQGPPGPPPAQQLMIRFPLPYRIGEQNSPGNADEKVRCEAGTYAWFQENCPAIPIPQLYGFGLTSGQTVCL